MVFKANNSNEDVGNDGEGVDETEANEGTDIEKVEINNVLLGEREDDSEISAYLRIVVETICTWQRR